MKTKTTYHNVAVALRKLADFFQQQIDNEVVLKHDPIVRFNHYSKEAECSIIIKHEKA